MNLVDLGVVLVLVAALFLGWRRGLLQPLVAEVAFLLAGWYALGHSDLLAGLTGNRIPAPLAGLGFTLLAGFAGGLLGRQVAGLMRRLPGMALLDGSLGAALNLAVAGVLAYVLLGAACSFDNLLGPLRAAAAVTSTQVADLERALAGDPVAASLVDPATLATLRRQAAAEPIPLSQLGQADALLGFWESDVHPQLAQSRVLPVVLAVGERIPWLGHHVDPPRPSP
ncbi:MAG: CvpA family protein [Candidatus Dormibacteria bacterium]